MTVTDRIDEERERRRRRLAWLFQTRAGTVAMLIAMVLITQAGLVYVAVDQIGVNEGPAVVQPARNSSSSRGPISVDAEDRDRAPAPAATREVVEVEEVEESEEPEEAPTDVGLDRARERAEPEGVAPPLTGSEPPAADPDAPPAQPAPEAHDESPGESERAASEAPSEAPTSDDATSAPPSETEEPSDEGPGASGGEPRGRGGDNPGNGDGNDNGKGRSDA